MINHFHGLARLLSDLRLPALPGQVSDVADVQEGCGPGSKKAVMDQIMGSTVHQSTEKWRSGFNNLEAIQNVKSWSEGMKAEMRWRSPDWRLR
jgi:hypothetical protein